MVISYRPGAGGALGWSLLNSLPGDGYTIMGINLPHTVLQPMEGNVQYKTEDLVPVHYFHYTGDALIVPLDSPYQTFADLVKDAKDKPSWLSFAGSATFSANHLAHEKFNTLAGVTTTYVAYKGTGDLLPAVLGHHVTGTMSYVPLAISQKGKMRTLAVALEKRHPALPDVPTFKELGFDWVDGAYRGVAVPRSTPVELRRRVSEMIDGLNRDPELRAKMVENGFEMTDLTYDRIPAFLAERSKEYAVMAKRMGLLK